MCQMKSGIILKDRVFIPDYDSHGKMLDELKVIAELKRFAEEHNVTGFKRENRDKAKFYIVYNCITKHIVTNLCLSVIAGDIYFSTQEIAEEAIKTIGEDRVKKYYLGVTDEL